ncbi:hypothetical protein IGI65_001765 [Enterococcus sp. DIV0755b]|uniref:GNAT family N-acetyltransferase n=1 Tax=Enterococcus sp. DIV0755b TaxID=2774657 RepID=UPI003F1F7030
MRFTWIKDTSEWEKAIPLIAQVSWQAGAYLAQQMKSNSLTDWENVLVCWNGKELVGFCALLKQDIVKETTLTPFIGVVFVAEKYRGRKISQQLVKRAERKAVELGFKKVFIATSHKSLYEKFGYHKIGTKEDIFDRFLFVYQKDLI